MGEGRHPVSDPGGAFCRHGVFTLAGRPNGPLAGLRLAVKDAFDVAGHVTGFGSPSWLGSHPPARSTAAAVAALLDAGADLIGKTVMDEMAFGLTGENAHYGAPRNPRAPHRLTGGSSSGSAAAVAGGLADVALGTDTAGSVRIPASFCGVFGFRPTHGRVSTMGVVPLAPGFDTVGWFSADAELLARVGAVLLGPWTPTRPRGLLLEEEAFALADPALREVLGPVVDSVTAALGPPCDVTVAPEGLDLWMERFRVLQGAEVWATHGRWVEKVQPVFGPAVGRRMAWARDIRPEAVAEAQAWRSGAVARLDALLGEGAILCLPTAPCTALPLHSSDEEQERFRARAIALTCIAGLGGLPQVTLPVGEVDGCPVGLSLIAGRGADGLLLDAARAAATAIG